MINTQPTRTFIIGTDTDIGKTHVASRLITSARAAGLTLLPFKPAESGEPGTIADSQRLADAAQIPAHEVACLRYSQAKAPGMVDEPTRFTRTRAQIDDGPLRRVVEHQRKLLEKYECAGMLVEGAGGLHVPMPGGSWQHQWISALADQVVVVARAGLGTINHTILTVDALRHLGLPIVGIIFNASQPIAAEFFRENVDVLINKCAIPALAIYGYGEEVLQPPDEHTWTAFTHAHSQP